MVNNDIFDLPLLKNIMGVGVMGADRKGPGTKVTAMGTYYKDIYKRWEHFEIRNRITACKGMK